MTRNTKALIGFCLLVILCIVAAGYAFGAEEDKCITTEDAMRDAMLQGGVQPSEELTGAATEPLKKWVAEQMGRPLSAKAQSADHVIIYHNGDAALIGWFHGTCMLGAGSGPWAPLRDFLGVPPDKAL